MDANNSKKLVLDTIARKSTRGIPSFFINIMDTDLIDEIAGVESGTYLKQPEDAYLRCLWNIGINAVDQYIPNNPLSMTKKGFDAQSARSATTGLEKIVLDGIEINSPEAVCEHLEKIVFPQLKLAIENFDSEKAVAAIIAEERAVQQKLGPAILKTGHGFVGFPCFRYGTYGYTNYFMAYALYPEIMEKDFSLQADYCNTHNRAAAQAIVEGGLPLLYRLDHDMADSRGTLVNIKSLEKIWFPHFERAITPLTKIPEMNLIWHCDGNLMQMIPLLLETGVKGFQGFQYEAGMDYNTICKMKTKDGNSLLIVAGVSVSTTLPFGTPDKVKKEMKWLVENGPREGLFLSASSSVAPNTNRENVLTFIEGLKYYRQHGRN